MKHLLLTCSQTREPPRPCTGHYQRDRRRTQTGTRPGGHTPRICCSLKRYICFIRCNYCLHYLTQVGWKSCVMCVLCVTHIGGQKCAEICNNICACPLKETLTVFMNVIVRGHIVHKVFATVRHKASVPSNTVFIWRRLEAGLLPTLDVTI